MLVDAERAFAVMPASGDTAIVELFTFYMFSYQGGTNFLAGHCVCMHNIMKNMYSYIKNAFEMLGPKRI